MAEHFWLGMAVILLAGLFNGSFALPMKYARQWRWEHTWLMYCAVGNVALPWLLSAAFVPRLAELFRGIPLSALVAPLAFGFLWGVANVTFGVAIDMVGIALTFAVVSGLTCLSGSLVPLLVLHPGNLFQAQGVALLGSLPILLAGLVLYGAAGRRREKEQPASQPSAGKTAGSFRVGLAICIFTGIFGSSFNLGFAFSGKIVRRSLELGASPLTSTYAVWAAVFTAGFLPPLLYCGYLLLRRSGWRLFYAPGAARDLALAATMGLLWFSGMLTYGLGATWVGRYGTSVGFALFMAVSILVSNLSGIFAGEWKATSASTRQLLAAGLAVILLSVVILNLAGIF